MKLFKNVFWPVKGGITARKSDISYLCLIYYF